MYVEYHGQYPIWFPCSSPPKACDHWHTCQVSRFKASNHVLTLTQKSTNRKISVNMFKLPQQNWFAKYRNSDPLAIYLNKCISVTSAYITHNGIEEPD
jgi:hypothetical protein